MERLEEQGDREAVRAFATAARGTASGLEEDSEIDADPYVGLGREIFGRVAVGMTSYPLSGGYQSVAEQMRELNRAGIDNVVVGFFDPARRLQPMEEHVMPLLHKMGVRSKKRPKTLRAIRFPDPDPANDPTHDTGSQPTVSCCVLRN